MNRIFMLILLIKLIIAFDDQFKTEGDVIIGTDKDFDDIIGSYEHLITYFYDPECHICKSYYTKQWSDLATKHRKKYPNIRFLRINGIQNPDSNFKGKVRGYPSLRLFIFGEMLEYKGGTGEGQISEFIENNFGKNRASIIQEGEIQKFKDKKKLSHLLVEGENPIPFENKYFEGLCKSHEEPCAIVKTSKNIRSSLGIADDSDKSQYVIFSDNGKTTSHFLIKDFNTEEFGFKNLIEFYNSNKFSKMSDYNHDVSSYLSFTGKPFMALFMNPKQRESVDMLDTVKEASDELKNKILIVKVSDIDNGAGKTLAQDVGVTKNMMPSIWILENTQSSRNIRKYRLEFQDAEQVAPEQIIQFYNDFSNDKIQSRKKSEDLPKEQGAGFVQRVVGLNFDSIVLNPKYDVLLMLYSTAEGKDDDGSKKEKEKLNMIFDKVKKYMPVKDFVLAEVDVALNDIPKAHHNDLPSIKFFAQKLKNRPPMYKGGQDEESILKFLKSKSETFKKHLFEIEKASKKDKNTEL